MANSYLATTDVWHKVLNGDTLKNFD